MKYTYLLALAGVVVAASTGFSQTNVPIVNPSFESGPTGQGSAPQSWTTSGNGNPNYIVSEYATTVTGQDGTDHVELFNWNGGAGGPIGSVATSVSQTLTTNFASGETYTLTALGAHLSAQAAITGGYFFLTSSAAPFTSLSTVDAAAPFTGSTTSMTTFTISGYTPTVADIGLPIIVGFYAPGQSASGAQTVAEIDDFVLTATPTPEPSSIAIAALGGFGLLGLIRRRRA